MCCQIQGASPFWARSYFEYFDPNETGSIKPRILKVDKVLCSKIKGRKALSLAKKVKDSGVISLYLIRKMETTLGFQIESWL